VEAPQSCGADAKEATMPRLTDTQLVILSAAAGREGGAVLPLSKSLKVRGGTVTNALKSLLKKGLVAERPARRDASAWRETEDGQRFALAISDAGLAAIGIDETDAPGRRDAAGTSQRKKSRGTTRTSSVKPSKPVAKKPSRGARPGTKQALLIDLMSRKRGATIAEIGKATGWQAHSVRGAISGTLKKKLGLAVASEKVDGRGRVYRIATRGRRGDGGARR
jgi:DNA-binding MarR family transcriptional regulator